MSDMTDAIDGVRSSSGTQAALLQPRNSDRPFSRRRSSSQTPQTYDVRNEEIPQDGFHNPAFQQALRDAQRLMSGLAEVLASGSFHNDPDSTIQRIHREVRDLAQFQCPPSRTVGFVGDSGVGT
jgi:hypothetical protein